jgi:hypothetical protein
MLSLNFHGFNLVSVHREANKWHMLVHAILLVLVLL